MLQLMYSTYTPYGMMAKPQNGYLQNQVFITDHKPTSPSKANGNGGPKSVIHVILKMTSLVILKMTSLVILKMTSLVILKMTSLVIIEMSCLVQI